MADAQYGDGLMVPIVPAAILLNIGCMPGSPLGHGFLTGQIRSTDDFADIDWRKNDPRFTGENFQRTLRLADEVQAIAFEAGATPAQVALARLLGQGDSGAPIPGTKRGSRVEENTVADGVVLTSEQLDNLSRVSVTPRTKHACACSNADGPHGLCRRNAQSVIASRTSAVSTN
jgi:aryl-alcohol dehydrogenase-like predicted oxidoreductase